MLVAPVCVFANTMPTCNFPFEYDVQRANCVCVCKCVICCRRHQHRHRSPRRRDSESRRKCMGHVMMVRDAFACKAQEQDKRGGEVYSKPSRRRVHQRSVLGGGGVCLQGGGGGYQRSAIVGTTGFKDGT